MAFGKVSRIVSGPILSVIWLAVCGGYISEFVGWNVLFSLLPHEIALVLLAALAPALAVVGIGAAQERTARLERVSARLAEQLIQIQGVPNRFDERTRLTLTSLRQQMEELNAAGESAASRLRLSTENLGSLVSGAVSSVNGVVERAEYARGDLEAVVAPLAKLTATLADETAALQHAASADLDMAIDRLRVHVATVQQAVDRGIETAASTRRRSTAARCPASRSTAPSPAWAIELASEPV